MSVSYQKNRDYTKQLHQTYELNCDLYNCFNKAKANPAFGYMKHMKQNWDIIHLEFSHLSGKNLSDRASRVIKNKNCYGNGVSKRQLHKFEFPQ